MVRSRKERTGREGTASQMCELSRHPRGGGPPCQRTRVKGGTAKERVLRGGSFVDSLDGHANHMLRVSTRMVNSADSGSHNARGRTQRT